MVTPQPSQPPERVKVLLASASPEDYFALRQIFDHSNWVLQRVTTCREAIDYLRDSGAPVVISNRELPDGDWKLVLKRLEALPALPKLIVTSRLTDDELWAEVLNLGGYDVLAQPFDAREVFRVIFLAWHAQAWDAKKRARAAQRRSALSPAPRSAPAGGGTSQGCALPLALTALSGV